jgi:hypothetical protein
MFLKAENHADLPCGICNARGRNVRRRLHYVVDDGLAGFIFEFVLRGGAKRRHRTTSHGYNSGQTV